MYKLFCIWKCNKIWRRRKIFEHRSSRVRERFSVWLSLSSLSSDIISSRVFGTTRLDSESSISLISGMGRVSTSSNLKVLAILNQYFSFLYRKQFISIAPSPEFSFSHLYLLNIFVS